MNRCKFPSNMTLQYKQNISPNAKTDDEVIHQIKLLKKAYSSKSIPFNIKKNESRLKTDKSTTTSDCDLNSLLKIIKQQHEQNSAQMNKLMNKFLKKYKEMTKASIQLQQQDEQDEQEDFQFIDSTLSILSSCEQNIQTLKGLNLIELIEYIIEITEIEVSQLYKLFCILKIENKQDILALILQKNVSQRKQKNQYFKPQIYLRLEIAQFGMQMIVKKMLQNSDSDIQQYLNQYELDIISYLYHPMSKSQILKQLENPQELINSYYHFITQTQIEDSQKNQLLKNFTRIKNKLTEYIQSIPNYARLIENAFLKEDSKNTTSINYTSFLKIFQSLKLNISKSEMNILFKHSLYKEFNIIYSIIDPIFKINYIEFLNGILDRKPLHINEQNKKFNEMNSKIGQLSIKVQRYKNIIDDLVQQKQKLLIILLEKQQKIQKLENKILQNELHSARLEEDNNQYINNQISVIKLKYESELKRLNDKNQTQNRVIQSYRMELQNILNYHSFQ